MNDLERDKLAAWERLQHGYTEVRTKKQVIEKFQGYVKTYKEDDWVSESDEIFLDDMLYYLGASLDDKFKFANGFSDFKELLVKHLSKKP